MTVVSKIAGGDKPMSNENYYNAEISSKHEDLEELLYGSQHSIQFAEGVDPTEVLQDCKFPSPTWNLNDPSGICIICSIIDRVNN